jgi:hypothetical protein
MDLTTHKITYLYDKTGNSVTDFAWLNSSHIIFTTIEVGYSVLYSIDVRNGNYTASS